MILARNLLGTLRNGELAQAAASHCRRNRLEHRPVADGQSVAGICRRSVMLVSGRYAMLDDGLSSLVPWRPVIESRRDSKSLPGAWRQCVPGIGDNSLGV